MRLAAALVFLVAFAAPALAQGGSGEDRGAIRSLGSVGHRHSSDRGIEIPHYVPTVRPAADQLPRGTEGPGPSARFIPAPRFILAP